MSLVTEVKKYLLKGRIFNTEFYVTGRRILIELQLRRTLVQMDGIGLDKPMRIKTKGKIE
ncbi:MAG: hypothetical protein H7178_00230 [Chitinophagaceae bacterium]|nr:hypothetical protein [Chitinophagaceae bacterium]